MVEVAECRTLADVRAVLEALSLLEGSFKFLPTCTCSPPKSLGPCHVLGQPCFYSSDLGKGRWFSQLATRSRVCRNNSQLLFGPSPALLSDASRPQLYCESREVLSPAM